MKRWANKLHEYAKGERLRVQIWRVWAETALHQWDDTPMAARCVARAAGHGMRAATAGMLANAIEGLSRGDGENA